MQSLPKTPLAKEPPKKDPPKRDNTKKDPPKGEPKPKNKDKEIELDVDAGDAIGNMTMQVPIKEITKLPSQRQHVKKALGIEKVEDRPIILQNIHLSNTNPSHEPFLLTLAMNDLFLHSCILDSGASANIMALKVMKQLNLEVTRNCKNLCGFDSKSVEVEGHIKDLKVSLAMNKDISLLMDVVVIIIPDVW